MDALSRYPVEHPGKNVNLRQEDIELAPILPAAASSCFLKGQAEVPLAGPAEIHNQEEWALIQQKNPDFMQLQCCLTQRNKMYFQECQTLSKTVRVILRQWGLLEYQSNVLYCQAQSPTGQPQLHTLGPMPKL